MGRRCTGLRQKMFSQGDQKIRLLEFSDNFHEAGWCRSGHAGFVLEGKISIRFAEEEITFETGDGLFIPPGDATRHRAGTVKGEHATLILFENI